MFQEMAQIPTENVTPALRALFRLDEPQARRCFAVLDGVEPQGKILTDDLAHPAWGVVWEPYDGTTFLGGSFTPSLVARVWAAMRREGEVLIGLWPGDPRQGLLPPTPDYDGRTLEFYDRPVGQGLDAYLQRVPEGCAIRRLDRDLILRTAWGPDDVRMAGGIDAWERTCMGYCLMRGDEILSEATAGPPAIGLREPGVFTQPAERGKGYATLVAAHLIHEIEAVGERTYWNCAQQNMASAAVAHKLGYRIEQEYRCIAWFKTK